MFLASAYTKKARDSSVTYPRFQAFALPTKQRISNVEAHAGRYTNEPHAPERMNTTTQASTVALSPCLVFKVAKFGTLEDKTFQ